MTTETAQKKRSNTVWYAVAAIIIVIVIIVGVVLYEQSLTPAPQGTAVTLYEGEIGSQYGFGNSNTSLTSPGPTLTFKKGQTYTMTVYNVGTLPHSWEICTTNNTSGQVLFNSQISPTIPAKGSGSVTFTPDQTGNFYYICPVAGHAALGMWGNVTITS